MKSFDELILVNYCYPDCIPLKNIMRLPPKEAFALASAFAESHPETTAFYRFADFENYYALRKKQDEYLYSRFIESGGMRYLRSLSTKKHGNSSFRGKSP